VAKMMEKILAFSNPGGPPSLPGGFVTPWLRRFGLSGKMRFRSSAAYRPALAVSQTIVVAETSGERRAPD